MTSHKSRVFNILVLFFSLHAFTTVLLGQKCPYNVNGPLNLQKIQKIIEGKTPDTILASCLDRWGIDFQPTLEFLQELKLRGGYPKTLAMFNSRIAAPLKVEKNSNESSKKLVKVLVANFDNQSGPDRSLRDAIIAKLDQAIRNYPDVEVKSIRQQISVSDGRSVARKLGEENNADLVLWGWYFTNGTSAMISVNLEVVSQIPYIASISQFNKAMVKPITDLDRYSFQLAIGDDYSALILLTLGLINEEKEDYKAAESQYTEALKIRNAPDDLSFHLYRQRGRIRFNSAQERGLSTLNSGIVDVEKALALKPDNGDVNYLLGEMYFFTGELEKGASLLLKASQITDDKQTKAVRLLKLAQAYGLMGDKEKLKNVLDQALTTGLSIADAESRPITLGLIYLAQGSFEKSRASFLAATEASSDQELHSLAFALVAGTFFVEDEGREGSETDNNLTVKINKYLKLAESDLDNIEILKLIGLIKNSRDDFEGAISAYSKVISLAPDKSEYYISRAQAFEGKKDLVAAQKDFEKAVKIDYDSVSAHQNKAAFHFRNKQPEDALTELDICLSIEEQPSLHERKAEIYEGKKDFLNAHRELLRVVMLDPEYMDSYFKKVGTYETLDKNPLETINQLMATEVSPYLLLERAGLETEKLKGQGALLENARYRTVVEDVDAAIDLAANNSKYSKSEHLLNVCKEIGNGYLSLNDNKNGIRAMTGCIKRFEALKTEPGKLYDYYNIRGLFFQISGAHREAVEDFTKGISYRAEALLYQHRSVSFREEGRFSEALKDINVAIEKDPKNIMFFDARAVIYEKMKDFENARKDRHHVIELNPEDYQSYVNYFTSARSYRRELNFDRNSILLDKLFLELKSPYLLVEKGLLYGNRIKKFRSNDKNYLLEINEFNKALAFSLNSSEYDRPASIFGVCRIVTDVLRFWNDPVNGIRFASSCIEELRKRKCECTFEATIINERGNFYYNTADFDKAIEDYSKSIEISVHATFLLNRADAYHRKNMLDAALNDITAAINNDSSRADCLFLRALIYRDKGLFEKALIDVKLAIEKQSDPKEKARYEELLLELNSKTGARSAL
jgi:tetratricopeptide (TPR) repeat protein